MILQILSVIVSAVAVVLAVLTRRDQVRAEACARRAEAAASRAAGSAAIARAAADRASRAAAEAEMGRRYLA